MKKLLTLAAFALATVSLHAATTTWGWQVANLYFVNTETGDEGIPSGMVSLVYNGNTMDSQNLDIDGNAIGSITGNPTDAAFSDGASWDAVVEVNFGGTTYKNTFSFTMPSGLTGDAQNDSQLYEALNQTLTATIMPDYYLDPSPSGNMASWTPVPEPTSVALLAIGLAALGLKRKVA